MEPSWYSELLASGEALACLSLCGNTAMQMRDDGAGSSVTYTPRGSVSGEVVPLLMQPFEYTVLFVANGGDGKSSANCLSRAIVLAPKHDEDALFICFRGARPPAQVGGRSPWPGHEADRDCILSYRSAPADMKYPGAPDGSTAHSGVAKYEALLCGISGDEGAAGGIDGGLIAWLREHLQKRPTRILLIGLSLGGSLAQAVALRLASQLPVLRSCMRILAFAPLAWASDGLATQFERTFASDAVTVVNCERRSGPAPSEATWAVPLPFANHTGPSSPIGSPQSKRPTARLQRGSKASGSPALSRKGIAKKASTVPEEPTWFSRISEIGSDLMNAFDLSEQEQQQQHGSSQQQHLVIDPAMAFFHHESISHTLRQPRVAICLYERKASLLDGDGPLSLIDTYPPALFDSNLADPSPTVAADFGGAPAPSSSQHTLSLDPTSLHALQMQTLKEGHPLLSDYTRLHMGRAYRQTLAELFLSRRPPGWSPPIYSLHSTNKGSASDSEGASTPGTPRLRKEEENPLQTLPAPPLIAGRLPSLPAALLPSMTDRPPTPPPTSDPPITTNPVLSHAASLASILHSVPIPGGTPIPMLMRIPVQQPPPPPQLAASCAPSAAAASSSAVPQAQSAAVVAGKVFPPVYAAAIPPTDITTEPTPRRSPRTKRRADMITPPPTTTSSSSSQQNGITPPYGELFAFSVSDREADLVESSSQPAPPQPPPPSDPPAVQQSSAEEAELNAAIAASIVTAEQEVKERAMKKQRSVERALCDLDTLGELTSSNGYAAFESLSMAPPAGTQPQLQALQKKANNTLVAPPPSSEEASGGTGLAEETSGDAPTMRTTGASPVKDGRAGSIGLMRRNSSWVFDMF